MSTHAFGKQAWIDLFRAIQLDDKTMQRWHAEFERRYPDDHERFLAWLGLAASEIDALRAAARGGQRS
jgi:hypothetical protein